MKRSTTTRGRLSAIATLAFALALLPAGCGGDNKATSGAAGAGDEAKASAAQPVSSKGKKWGGWRWKGKRDDCFFVYNNRCFDQKQKACKAAKCKESACVVDGSAPAKINCRKS